MDAWKSNTAQVTSSDELVKCIQKARLFQIATDLEYKIDDSDIESLRDMSRTEKILTSVFDVILPFITILVTLALLAVLFTGGKSSQALTLLVLHWVLSGVCYST